MYEGDGRFPRIGGKRDISAYATQKMSTDEVPIGARFDYWIDACRSMFGGFEFVDVERKGFHAALNMLTVDNLAIGHYVGTPHAMNRTKSHIRSSDNDTYLVILASERVFNLSTVDTADPIPAGSRSWTTPSPFWVPIRKAWTSSTSSFRGPCWSGRSGRPGP